MSEQKIQSDIIKFLERQNSYVVKVIRANRAGVPDILACYKGRFYAFEVKTSATLKRVTPLQSYNIEKINLVGGCAFVVSSVAEVETLLKETDHAN